MNRRDFLKLSLYAGGSCLIPGLPGRALAGPLDQVTFDPAVYYTNQPQTIMVFLYGGASELAGNFTNYYSFRNLSYNSYEDYFGSNNLVPTTHGFWNAAGGNIMESLLASHDLNVFRTCFSQVRWDNNNRSHGPCVTQNQRGTFNDNASGIFANLAWVLKNNNIVNQNTKMPFLTMDGDSGFYAIGGLPRISYIQPISINENLDNPFSRDYERDYTNTMDALAQARNQALNLSDKITDAFQKRSEMEDFIDEIDNLPDPALGNDNYDNNSFARKLKTAIKIMNHNPDTRVITLATSGLGGWDDHNDAENYLDRMEGLFRALKSAMAHIRSVNKRGQINIMIMGDFGRGVNLNTAYGWDHGNLQSFFLLGGTDYFRTPGIVGNTVVSSTGEVNRLYLKPGSGSYWFEPLSVASTIYTIYGITNPEVLTNNNPAINPPGNPLIKT
ncbi:MAG: hypothetical protein DSY89_04385 [Deltaproteobacteria bacterium]|nr:MAG: hypothetical protein DSY89_04385 [Deltaproteobacteria bacterium]